MVHATITPIHTADLVAEGELMPVLAYLVEHPDARVLVDTGLLETHPAAADLDPRVRPLEEWGLDVASVDIVVNTHLHFDHCGGNRMFAGRPVYVQRAELDDARALGPEYTVPQWVDPPDAALDYVPVDGELELLPGVLLVPAPGHTRGSQIVVVETDAGRVVIAGDTAVWSGELDEPTTDGQRLILALDPAEVLLAHQHEPWRP
ncbi:N-acyl homoserine lactonase family protein [Protaetiibacter sp. SSC-01]|uniref:N-acyl homoserine lactonase family protein n=1 Tax=Protaetiibacter sp. SSC-01 TaxID=2759943 RepID=UPI0016572940|nr:N-acyl homoserine lactonase family protein [Protaetiibacter sp. SSC-01]QNO36533.1 N-acyl homoserine lactonase family protein [Protaetiibacter sp. SSC-01]